MQGCITIKPDIFDYKACGLCKSATQNTVSFLVVFPLSVGHASDSSYHCHNMHTADIIHQSSVFSCFDIAK